MKLTMRTILVLVFGVVISLGLYIWADSTYGEFMGPGGLNPSFSTLISTWRSLGGVAAPIDAGQMGGGGSPFGGGGHQEGLADGLDLEKAPGQTGSDLLWIGVPALIGGVIEIVWTAVNRRKRKATA
jgi:hypothetical protein